MDVDFSDVEPSPQALASIPDFIAAYEAFHDTRGPTKGQVLERAARVASESMRGIEMQCR